MALFMFRNYLFLSIIFHQTHEYLELSGICTKIIVISITKHVKLQDNRGYTALSLSYVCSGGSKGAQRMHAPPGSKFFQFHAVFGQIWQNCMLAPPGGLVPPPRGNPGSAIDV